METAHRLKLVESVCTLITICSYTVPSSLLPQKVRNMVCRFNLIKRPWNWRNRESRTVPFIQVLGLFTKFCVSNHRRRIYSDWQALQGNDSFPWSALGGRGKIARKGSSRVGQEWGKEKSLRSSISFLTRPSSCQASLKVTFPPLLPLPLATPVKQASYYRTNRNAFKQCIPIFHGLLETALNNVVSPLKVVMQIHHTVCRILNHLSESSQRVLNQVTQWILQREQTKSWKSPQHVVRWGVGGGGLWEKYRCTVFMLPRWNSEKNQNSLNYESKLRLNYRRVTRETSVIGPIDALFCQEWNYLNVLANWCIMAKWAKWPSVIPLTYGMETESM